MNSTKKIWALGTLAALALAASACQDKPAEPKTDDPSAKNGAATTTANAATTATAVTATPTPVTISDSDLATPADFEEAAEKSITSKNYKTELGTIEKDLEKDGT